jgi:hypothetical protein
MDRLEDGDKISPFFSKGGKPRSDIFEHGFFIEVAFHKYLFIFQTDFSQIKTTPEGRGLRSIVTRPYSTQAELKIITKRGKNENTKA